MQVDNFLESLQPGLTAIAALFAILLVFINLAWFFFNHEKTLQEENLTKVKELNLTFRKKNIEKRVEKLFVDLKLSGFNWGRSSLKEMIYPLKYEPAEGKNVAKLLEPDEIIRILEGGTSQDAEETINEEASQFAFSDTGQNFFSALDLLYSKKHSINKQYKWCKTLCRVVSLCSMMIAILAIVGMGMFSVKSGAIWIHLWIFSGVSVFVVGVASLCGLLICRHKINEDWENQFLYGEEA